MELLESYLDHHVRIPEPTQRIYKHECCLSFDNPMSEHGLYIDMYNFLAFGYAYVASNIRKNGHSVYFHIKKTKKVQDDKKPIGIDNNEYEGIYTIVAFHPIDDVDDFSLSMLPDSVSYPFPSDNLPEKVKLAALAISQDVGVEYKDQLAAWTAFSAVKKLDTTYAKTLVQTTKIIIPPSGWKCASCDNTTDLWLNLSDGLILCGRKYSDGSGGNGHALEHYRKTGHPLAVKLGTVTADLDVADVFSYPENQIVSDPLLAEHLTFFGIDYKSLQKTEMTTVEKEFTRFQKCGKEVELIPGARFDIGTGLVNLGNSSYLAATMQVVLSCFCFRSWILRIDVREVFETTNVDDPTRNTSIQLRKLAAGLIHGRYSVPVIENADTGSGTTSVSVMQEGIQPQMFKGAVAGDHQEFSSMRQQDALEFFLHFLDKLEQDHAEDPISSPARSFKFGVEHQIMSSSNIVYNRSYDYVLSLNIPLTPEYNPEHEKYLQYVKARKPKAHGDEIKRPRLSLQRLLLMHKCGVVDGFYDTSLNAKTTVSKSTRLTSFPDYLVLHIQRFVMGEGCIPQKLDVCIDVPDTIDIGFMGEKITQLGEKLPCEVPAEDESETNASDDVTDGKGIYQLRGFVSHLGTSTDCGHYVAHVLKHGRWLLFNDNIVGIVRDPPKDMGYLYFFERDEAE